LPELPLRSPHRRHKAIQERLGIVGDRGGRSLRRPEIIQALPTVEAVTFIVSLGLYEAPSF